MASKSPTEIYPDISYTDDIALITNTCIEMNIILESLLIDICYIEWFGKNQPEIFLTKFLRF